MSRLTALPALALLALAAFPASTAFAAEKGAERPAKVFSHPDRIRYDGRCLTIDGRDTFIYSAAFHYFRCPKELWRERFRSIKEAGFNTVETYTPWNWHERDMPSGLGDTSKFDFTELREWLKMAQDEFGLYTIVRPGPFICAEWAGGGYPRWIGKYVQGAGDKTALRGSGPEHIAWSVHWYAAVCKEFAREQITRKPKGAKGIILVQLENEYDYHGDPDKPALLRALYDAAKGAGVEVPLFGCVTGQLRGSKDAKLSQVFDCDNYYVGLTEADSCARRMASLREKQPDAPGFVTELQGGWFSTVGGGLSDNHPSDWRHFNAISQMSILGGATGLNPYMFFGGTHFAGWGARGMTTTYDYNAPLHESGLPGRKYFVAKKIGEFIRTYETQLVNSTGGLCELRGAPKNVVGGIRVAKDGTRFVFLLNKDPKQPASGTLTVVPGKSAASSEPVYNINQYGEKVLMNTGEAKAAAAVEPFDITYSLADLGAQVIVIPPSAKPEQGVRWFDTFETAPAPAELPPVVRIATALTRAEDFAAARWQPLPEGKSLPELGVNDARYSLYRARLTLDAASAAKFTRLPVNTFSRDLVFASVNGKAAKRLYPTDKWVLAGCRNNKLSHKRIRPDEFDNLFDVSGLLHEGANEIVLTYENIGHEHGYIPMEELAGVRLAGLSSSDTAVESPLRWEFARDLAGVSSGWILPNASAAGWKSVSLDTTSPIVEHRKNEEVAELPAGVVWYRVEFELPGDEKAFLPRFARVQATGSGYLWLNGHNIGRDWEIGPQRDFFLPDCWLNRGAGRKNTLVFGLRPGKAGAELKAVEIAPYKQPAR